MEINRQIYLLKKALEKTTNFDDEQEKIDFILDVTSEFKQLIIADVMGSEVEFCQCDGVQDLIAGTGECRKCGKECTY